VRSISANAAHLLAMNAVQLLCRVVQAPPLRSNLMRPWHFWQVFACLRSELRFCV